ncbi:MAG: class I SAM-dependent methyltransferase [Acidimicrobiales bacterium]|nr:class I SAM-dependent methyltransferase [Acidimicrobiales bacterium]MCB9394035.1 class I SAM-dependent methyltransferase [Acidimicrobiaceae bacterium]
MGVKTTVREGLRQAMHRTGVQAPLRLLRRLRGQDTTHLTLPELSDRFDYIYEHGIWSGDVAPPSGLGSSLAATEGLRAELPALLDELGVRSLLDLGCGDYTWMQTLSLDVEYHGVDVSARVIEQNRRDHPEVRFSVLDATSDEIPRADAVLCREVLFHLSLADSLRVIDNLRRSGSTYLLTTSDDSSSVNADIVSGDFRPINLCRAPFDFPAPIARIDDAAISKSRHLGVWRIDSLGS